MIHERITVLAWLGRGTIRPGLGMIRGFVGSCDHNRFQRRPGDDRDRQRLRDSLTEGVVEASGWRVVSPPPFTLHPPADKYAS